jgi:3-dehydroquinate synthetase
MSHIPASIFARLNVDLGERSYPIIIGSDLLTDVELIRTLPSKRIAVVTNTVVAPLYRDIACRW